MGMPGKSFQSKLEPHFDFIREARRKRQTWEAIVQLLAAKGITTTRPAVYSFLKRRMKRRYPLGMAPEAEPVSRPVPKRASHELPELTEPPPPASEFANDPLTMPTKGRRRSLWTVIKPQS
jgi:hypothetical protein